MAKDEVGQPLEEAEVVMHADGPTALLALEQAMFEPTHRCEGRRFMIRNPRGVEQPFDATYTEVFGEPPVYRDNKLNLYPRLNKYRNK